MRLPDPEHSRIVLIGTSQYIDDHFGQLPEVVRNLDDLAAAFTDSSHGIVPADNCLILADEGDVRHLGRRLKSAAASAKDLLLVYYSGHGLIAGRKHELYLGLPDSEWDAPEFNSLEYEKLRGAVLDSPAQNKVIVLDCCFSGRAVGDFLADSGSAILGQLDVKGSYVLTSAQGNEVALKLPDEKHTAFTGRLIQLLCEGVPDGPELLSVEYLYQRLRWMMQAEGLSSPSGRALQTTGQIALAVNRSSSNRYALEDKTVDKPPLAVALERSSVKPAGDLEQKSDFDEASVEPAAATPNAKVIENIKAQPLESRSSRRRKSKAIWRIFPTLVFVVAASAIVTLGPEIERLAGNPRPEASSSPAASPSTSKSVSAVPAKVAPLRQLKPPQIFALSSKAMDEATLARIKRLRGVISLEPVGAATIEVNGRHVQALAVNPSTFRAYTIKVTAESDIVWQSVANGGLAVSFSTDINGAQPGDRIMSGTHSLYIAAQANTGIQAIDIVLSLEVGKLLGMRERNALLVHAPTANSVELREAILKILPAQSQVAAISLR